MILTISAASFAFGQIKEGQDKTGREAEHHSQAGYNNKAEEELMKLEDKLREAGVDNDSAIIELILADIFTAASTKDAVQDGANGLTSQTLLLAYANIEGVPGSGISGKAIFIQAGTGILPTVLVIVRVEGLEPGSVHGMHIHEVGACAPTFGAAGGHFDPGPFGASHPDDNHPFHMGDLPNLKADENGVAVLKYRTSRITLSPGPLSVFDEDGSGIIVHGNEDQGTNGIPGGAGGPRIACGVLRPLE